MYHSAICAFQQFGKVFAINSKKHSSVKHDANTLSNEEPTHLEKENAKSGLIDEMFKERKKSSTVETVECNSIIDVSEDENGIDSDSEYDLFAHDKNNNGKRSSYESSSDNDYKRKR